MKVGWSVGSEMQSDPGYTLKVELLGFADTPEKKGIEEALRFLG
jgi:hypothetical protein